MTAQTQRLNLSRWRDLGAAYGAPIALVLLVLVNALFTESFATSRTLLNILLQVSTTVIVASGMTFVIATGGIDLSVGAVMAIASTTAVLVLPFGAFPAACAGLGAGLLVGLINGFFVAVLRIAPFIVTLAVLIAGRGVAQVISGEGELIPFEDPAFLFLGRGRLGPIPVQAVIMGLCVLAAWFVMREMAFGRYTISIGGNEDAAHLAGVPVRRTKWLIYAASGLLSGVAGLIETARLGTTDAANIGLNMELAAIAAVVVGGTSLAGGRATLPGSVIGALIMAVIGTSFAMLRLPYASSLVATGAIILLAVWLQRPRLA